jgi:hypothetical protein
VAIIDDFEEIATLLRRRAAQGPNRQG